MKILIRKIKDTHHTIYWGVDDMFHKLPLLIQNLIIYIVVYTLIIGQYLYFASRPYTQ